VHSETLRETYLRVRIMDVISFTASGEAGINRDRRRSSTASFVVRKYRPEGA
jgi:hypothetical protein